MWAGSGRGARRFDWSAAEIKRAAHYHGNRAATRTRFRVGLPPPAKLDGAELGTGANFSLGQRLTLSSPWDT